MMKRTVKSFQIISLALAVIFALITLKTIIDHRNSETLAAFTPGNSPIFSAKEAAQEIPAKLQWQLVDDDGNMFDWIEFCHAHKNCFEIFREKNIPMPVVENFSYRPENMSDYYDRIADQREREEYCDMNREECPDGGPAWK